MSKPLTEKNFKKVVDKLKKVCYNKYRKRDKEVIKMIKWYKRYRFCKRLGIKHPFKASLDKGFIQN